MRPVAHVDMRARRREIIEFLLWSAIVTRNRGFLVTISLSMGNPIQPQRPPRERGRPVNALRTPPAAT